MLAELQSADVTFANEATVLRNVTIDVGMGERIAVIGPSGSGKTTLLTVLGLLRKPTAGHYRFNGLDPWNGPEPISQLRASGVSWVFQSMNLLMNRTAVDNVVLGLLKSGVTGPECTGRARSALRQVGLEGMESRRARTLSGGEAQRVAVARALVRGAKLVCADEPTANLDPKSRDAVVDSLFRSGTNSAIVLATHDLAVAERAHRVIRIENGEIQDDSRSA